MHKNILLGGFYVLSESFLHLPLRPIFRQLHPNFRGGRNANASEIWAQLTKNLFAKSSTKRFREYIFHKIRHRKIPGEHKKQQEEKFHE